MTNEQETEEPWRVSPPIEPWEGPTYWAVVRDRSSFPEKFTDSTHAEAKRDELNKLEAIREAAPELLEACKRALPWLSADYPEHPVTVQVRAAIQKAESCSTKSNG